jgi:hypothetical protein
MNQSARLQPQARLVPLGALLSSLGAAVRDTAAFVFVREAHAFFVTPRAFRYPVSKRAQRFMRGGD